MQFQYTCTLLLLQPETSFFNLFLLFLLNAMRAAAAAALCVLDRKVYLRYCNPL